MIFCIFDCCYNILNNLLWLYPLPNSPYMTDRKYRSPTSTKSQAYNPFLLVSSQHRYIQFNQVYNLYGTDSKHFQHYLDILNRQIGSMVNIGLCKDSNLTHSCIECIAGMDKEVMKYEFENLVFVERSIVETCILLGQTLLLFSSRKVRKVCSLVITSYFEKH